MASGVRAWSSVGLVALVALVLAALAGGGHRDRGVAAGEVDSRENLLRGQDSLRIRVALVLKAANGAEVAALLQAHALAHFYEDGMTALPVDYRRCRCEDCCASGPGDGAAARSSSGEPLVASPMPSTAGPKLRRRLRWRGRDCSGERAGNLYLQYRLYYLGSATAEGSTFPSA